MQPHEAAWEPLVVVEVNGRPATFSTASERPWKNSIRAAVQATGVVPPENALFSVRIEFRKPPPVTVNDAWDIDNLIKPTLDAMEGVFGARPVRGKMVPQPADDRVEHVEAWKRTVREEEQTGAKIEIRSRSSNSL